MNNERGREANSYAEAIEVKEFVVHESQDIGLNRFAFLFKNFTHLASQLLQIFLIRIGRHLRQSRAESTDPPLR